MSGDLILGLLIVALAALFGFISGFVYMTLRGFLPACIFIKKLISEKDANDFIDKHLDRNYANNDLDAWYSKREAMLFLSLYQCGFAFGGLKGPQSRFMDALEDDVFLKIMQGLANKWIERYKKER